jgi:hypothetical protein
LSRAVVSSISVYSAAGDLGLHHGLDGLFALACDANGELIERGHPGMVTTEQTCQRRAAEEVQFLQIDASFNSVDVWNAQKSQQSSWLMTTEQTCQRRAALEVQFLQIDASFNSVDVWNAQRKSAVIMGGDY